jgi:hypothetical protein
MGEKPSAVAATSATSTLRCILRPLRLPTTCAGQLLSGARHASPSTAREGFPTAGAVSGEEAAGQTRGRPATAHGQAGSRARGTEADWSAAQLQDLRSGSRGGEPAQRHKRTGFAVGSARQRQRQRQAAGGAGARPAKTSWCTAQLQGRPAREVAKRQPPR